MNSHTDYAQIYLRMGFWGAAPEKRTHTKTNSICAPVQFWVAANGCNFWASYSHTHTHIYITYQLRVTWYGSRVVRVCRIFMCDFWLLRTKWIHLNVMCFKIEFSTLSLSLEWMRPLNGEHINNSREKKTVNMMGYISHNRAHGAGGKHTPRRWMGMNQSSRTQEHRSLNSTFFCTLLAAPRRWLLNSTAHARPA